jgi:hypothetical protein
MDMLLYAASVIAFGGVGLVLGLTWFYKFRIRDFYAYGLAAAINQFPGRVRLVLKQPFTWRKGDRGEQRVAALRALGFIDVAGFSIAELPDARLFALWHPQTGLVGVVNEWEHIGTWSDVLLFPVTESQPIVASSIIKRSHFYLLPGDPKIHKPDATPVELMEAVQNAAGAGSRARIVTAENFAALFEAAFAEATDKRLLDPLPDYEIRRLAVERGSPCSGEIPEKEFASLKQLLPLAIENQLRLVCGAQFSRETELPAAEWQHAAQRLLVLHDRTPLRRLAGRLIYGAFLTKEMKRRLRRARGCGSPRAAFAELNAKLPTWERYRKIGVVTRPVPADVYRAPIQRPTA